MAITWIADAETLIFTSIDEKVSDKYITKYPNLYFTREQENDELEVNQYPAVYIYFSEIEIGRDLLNDVTNAVLMTMNIDVTVSESMGIEGAQNVIYECMECAKQFGFNIQQMPLIQPTGKSVKRMVAKAERVIGYNDILYI